MIPTIIKHRITKTNMTFDFIHITFIKDDQWFNELSDHDKVLLSNYGFSEQDSSDLTDDNPFWMKSVGKNFAIFRMSDTPCSTIKAFDSSIENMSLYFKIHGNVEYTALELDEFKCDLVHTITATACGQIWDKHNDYKSIES